MNKTLARLVLALGTGVAALVGTTPTAGATIDAKGPDCAEILGGSATYAFGDTPLTRVVRSRMNLEAPACADITYRMVVSYTTLQGVAVSVETTEFVAEGTTVDLVVTVSDLDAPGTVSATVTTSKRNKAYDETSTEIVFDALNPGGGGSYQG